MKKYIQPITWLTVAITFLLVLSCASDGQQSSSDEKPMSRRERKLERKRQASLEKLRNLKEGEIYVVGRVELMPGLDKTERTGRSRDKIRNKMWVFFSDAFVDTTDNFRAMRHMTQVQLAEFFIAKSRPTNPVYFSGATLLLSDRKSGKDPAAPLILPGNMLYPVKPGARAIYAGTLIYHRDEFNHITKTEIVDEYDKAKAFFQETIGDPGITLERSLPKKQTN